MLTALCVNNNLGSWGNYPELEVGKEYEVADLDVGRFYSSVFLAGFGNKAFNTVCFNFYENGIEINVYERTT